VATAGALGAAKLIFLSDAPVLDADGAVRPELTANEAERLLADGAARLSKETRTYLGRALEAVRAGVERAHVVRRNADGALLLELFTHEGSGSMITADKLERLRRATIEDVGGILRLIEPLEADGTLVRRGRELLEQEIGRFTVLEHDRLILGCAALYPFPKARAGELACLAVQPDYRGAGHGEKIMEAIAARARAAGMKRLFVLTTRATHWFVERGFHAADVDELPAERKLLYNWQRRSKVLVRPLR
jgi:amino-acid N-acetyltransferase